jgi:hypothetical protein
MLVIPSPPPLPPFPAIGIPAAPQVQVSKAPPPPPARIVEPEPPAPITEEAKPQPTPVKRGRPPGKRSEEDPTKNINFLATQADNEYRGPPAILNLEARDILANRYSVTCSGTRKKGHTVLWRDFASFFEHIRLYAPEDFNVNTFRIYHDPTVGPPNSIGPENIRFVETGKARMKVIEKKCRVADVKISPNHAKMILLAAEIASRICSYAPGVSLQQILLESLAAVDMEF